MILFGTLFQIPSFFLFLYLGFAFGILYCVTLVLTSKLSTKKILKSNFPANKNKENNTRKAIESKESMQKETHFLDEIIKQRKMEKKKRILEEKIKIKAEKRRIKQEKKQEKIAKINEKKLQKQSKKSKTNDKKILIKKNKKRTKTKNIFVKKVYQIIKKQIRIVFPKTKVFLKKVCHKFVVFLRNSISTIIRLFVFLVIILSTIYLNFVYNYGEFRVMSIVVFFASFFVARVFVNLLAKFFCNIYNKVRKKSI